MSVRNATVWSMAGQMVVFVIQFLTSVIISRFFLAPDEIGVFALALSIAFTVQLIQDFGLARYISNAANLTDEEINGCSMVALAAGVLVAVLIFALAGPASGFFRAPDLRGVITIIGASILVGSFGVVPLALMQRNLRFREISAVNAVSIIVYAAAAIGLAALGWSSYALAWAVMAQQIVKTVVALAYSWATPQGWVQLAKLKHIFKFGLQMSALNTLASISMRTPEIVVGRLLDMTAVGLFTRAGSFTEQLRGLFGNALNAVMLPAFAKLRDAGDPGGPHYERVVACYTGILWPAMALLCVLAYPVVHFLFGERWLGVVPLLQFITLAQIVHSGLPLHMEMPMVYNKTPELLKIHVLDTSASLIMLALMANISLVAAAASRPIYAVVWYGIYCMFLKRIIGFRWRSLATSYLKSGGLVGLTILPALIVMASVGGQSHVSLLAAVLCGAVGGVLWLGGAYLFKHPIYNELYALTATIRFKLSASRA